MSSQGFQNTVSPALPRSAPLSDHPPWGGPRSVSDSVSASEVQNFGLRLGVSESLVQDYDLFQTKGGHDLSFGTTFKSSSVGGPTICF